MPLLHGCLLCDQKKNCIGTHTCRHARAQGHTWVAPFMKTIVATCALVHGLLSWAEFQNMPSSPGIRLSPGLSWIPPLCMRSHLACPDAVLLSFLLHVLCRAPTTHNGCKHCPRCAPMMPAACTCAAKHTCTWTGHEFRDCAATGPL